MKAHTSKLSQRSHKKGFTLVELLVVVAIIAILATMATTGAILAKNAASK
ncbi:MAG: prepilin-type N-terminal cleavage/methylation domain-containing protein, partial [Akkermansiaceae bacterium]